MSFKICHRCNQKKIKMSSQINQSIIYERTKSTISIGLVKIFAKQFYFLTLVIAT